MLLFVSFWTASATVVGSRIAVTPVEKVVELLEKLKEKVVEEGKAEAGTYDKFACFCKDKSTSVSESVTKGQDAIQSASATIELGTADIAAMKVRLTEAHAKKDEASAKKTETEARCARDKEEYEASNADISKAIDALVNAIKVLQSSKTSKAQLLTVKQTVKQSLAVAEALKIVTDGPRWAAAAAFLQSSVDPDDAEYKFHSHGIIQIMEKLETDFKKTKADADAEWQKTSDACKQTIKDFEGQISLAINEISSHETAIGDTEKLVAETRGDLVEHESSLKDSQLYMTDLTALCEKRAKEWDQRTVMRAGELKALTDALSILLGKVTETDSVNKRALLQKKQEGNMAAVAVHHSGLSFFQGSAESAHKSNRRLLVRGAEASAEAGTAMEGVAQRQRVNNALALLRTEGQRLDSMSLSSLAVRIAADPFIKVKTLIQNLVERLLAEATEEATKKGFCDEELGKNEQDRQFRWQETQKLNSELRSLEAKKLELEMEIEDLSLAVKDLTEALAEATQARKDDNEQNLKDIKTANEGLLAVTEAIMILKSFYKGAAKAEALLQENASPVEEDSPGAGFDGAYRGKQQASTGIIGLLEVIKSDYQRTVSVTTKDEEEAQATFVEFDRASKTDISGKSTKVELDTEDLKTTDNLITQKMEEMTKNMDLVDKALEALEGLKPMCIDTGMSYTERTQKREEEIKALKQALCILDPEQTEPECQN